MSTLRAPSAVDVAKSNLATGRLRALTPYGRAVAGCVGLSMLLRLRFVFTPLNTDEGGYLAIARAWAHGGDLYADLFLDRPQGLFALYRLLNALTGGTTASVRVMAIAFGAVAVVSSAEIARRLASPRAGIVAAFFAAVTSSAPALEGFTGNGELPSGTLSAAAIAVAVAVLTGRLDDRWMILAGTLGGLALSIKQSGFDGLVVPGVWLVMAVAFGWGGPRRALRRLAALVAGFSVVALVLVVHGALTGWHDWWYAVATYRLQTRSAFQSPQFYRFFETLHDALPILLPLIVVGGLAGLGELGARRSAALHGLRSEHALLPLWIVTASAAFLVGGQFYDHYWMILTLPLSVTAGVILGSLQARGLVVGLALLAATPALWSAVRFITLPRSEVPLAINPNEASIREEHIGSWFEAVRRPGDSLYVMCARASIYAHARADPPHPALWFYDVHLIPDAQPRLRAMLISDDGPTFVVAFQKPSTCGLKGEYADVFSDQYEPYAKVDGIVIHIRKDDDR